MKIKWPSLYCLIITLFCFGCKQNYEPPVIQQYLGALVVDGFINNSADTTFISLARTKRLGDISGRLRETGARLVLEDESGNVLHNFREINDTGIYYVPGMNLSFNNKYRLRIATTDRREYLSDPIPVIKTPPMDSINWRKDDKGLTIYANTHDPDNNTLYYRWEFSETWQYHAAFFSTLIYDGGLRDRFPEDYIYECWRTDLSTQLMLASSSKLSQDIIYENPIRFIPQDAIELSIKYFIMVKQFALTKEYYIYLENLKKITEQTGSIFDIQPSELRGNIHAVNDNNERVLGYITASTVDTKKMYIKNDQVLPWHHIEPCAEIRVPYDRIDNYLKSGGLIPLYIDGAGNDRAVLAAEPVCADCQTKGGSTKKPDFWQ